MFFIKFILFFIRIWRFKFIYDMILLFFTLVFFFQIIQNRQKIYKKI